MSARPNPPNSNYPICKGTGRIEGVAEHQLGLEKTPEEYVQHLVEVFREVRRVLRADGTLWLNLGDSYAGGGQTGRNDAGNDFRPGRSNSAVTKIVKDDGLKPKDLVGIPWRVAFALQADGWYLRSDIIWSKPNPMPESVTDRPTKSHEYIFLLTKSARYFYDQEAVREKPSTSNWPGIGPQHGDVRDRGEKYEPMAVNTGRNKRSVWTMTTRPYPEAHFATFPPELPETCIKAGTSLKGCCDECGAPWERIVRSESFCNAERGTEASQFRANLKPPQQSGVSVVNHTLGWQPTCECDAEVVPCVVLDPFAGSGTTGLVARNLGRKAILIELNPIYGQMIVGRSKSDVPDILAFGTENGQGGEVG